MNTENAGHLIAIDPGNAESAYVIYCRATGRPVTFAKIPNAELLQHLRTGFFSFDAAAVEMVACYGMAVGKDVFETSVWIGRFAEAIEVRAGTSPRFVYRRETKMHLCGNMKAKDPNIRQALIDRYGPTKEIAIGKKKTPGPLYGMSGDCWAALSVAVTCADSAASPLTSEGQ